jgi:hypothetical protein
MTTELKQIVNHLLKEFYLQELMKAADEDLKPRPERQSFTGLFAWAEEWKTYVPSFTPRQFNAMWELFSHREKIKYVQSLIKKE